MQAFINCFASPARPMRARSQIIVLLRLSCYYGGCCTAVSRSFAAWALYEGKPSCSPLITSQKAALRASHFRSATITAQ
jgi:hypothetical protein